MGERRARAPAVATPLEQQVLAERVGMIIAQTPQGVAGPAALATIGAVVLWNRASPWPLALTLGALSFVLGSWLLFFRRYRRWRPEPNDIGPWVRGATLRTLAHGCCWGAYSLVAFRHGSVMHQSVDVAFMYGLVAGAVVVDGPHFPTFAAFALPTLLPVIVRCFVEGTPASVAVGSAGIVGLGHGLFAALNASRLTERSSRAGLENRALLAELERQSELAEQARRVAEAANREKSRFLAAASHDLRQPVHALSLLAAAAEQAADDAERRRIVAHMAGSVASLSALFDSLLEISRLEAGILEPELTTVSLRDVLVRLAAELAPEAEARGLRLRVRARELSVRADRILLERLLRNLLANALAYTERGGILLAARPRQDRVRIEVWDSGIGIAPEQLAHVFEPFFQIGNPERDRKKGVGLGLSIVERLAALLEARVHVTSRLGHGSRFAVELPLVRSRPRDEAKPEPAVDHDEAALVGAVVVVIDDEADVLGAVETLLRQAGCRVIAVDSARRAEELLAAAHLTPDAVLSDLRLSSNETGLSAIAFLRSHYGPGLPAALITGDTAAERLVEVSESGLPTLHKPVRPHELERLLSRLLGALPTSAP
jgi:signal transduction histidine kinase/CheY-like chemotaxis protein